MRIKPCPKCGRLPKIDEWKSTRKGIRRYGVYCPNLCLLFKHPCGSFLEINGNIDDNTIIKKWNEAISNYKEG